MMISGSVALKYLREIFKKKRNKKIKFFLRIRLNNYFQTFQGHGRRIKQT